MDLTYSQKVVGSFQADSIADSLANLYVMTLL